MVGRFRATALAAALLVPTAAGADRLDTRLEKAIGPLVARTLASGTGTDDDPLLTVWVRGIGAKVAAQSPRDDLSPRFEILASDVANALTLPGGTVFVTRGLLDSVASDDELAGVLAHETAHVSERHATRQLLANVVFLGVLGALSQQPREVQIGAVLLNLLRTLQNSRANESRADALGVIYAAAAGYEPRGLTRFLEGLGRGSGSRLEEYFATHPNPERRIADLARSPWLTAGDPDTRFAMAAGFDARGLTGLAQRVRVGQDPLQVPEVAPRALRPDLARERRDVVQRSDEGLKRLTTTYKAQRLGGTLQQVLLINNQVGDLRWVYLAARAYGVQSRVQDLYARQLRLLRTAPPMWERLSTDALDDARGRAEIRRALEDSQGATAPLERASQATALVLADLNNRLWRLNRNQQWLRYAALEGMLRLAEGELARADRASGTGWRRLALARIRAYERRLDQLAPESDPVRRELWSDLLRRRLGRPFDTRGASGAATVRAALAIELGREETELEAARDPTAAWADTVLAQEGIPENIATVLRLLTLDLEREMAARGQATEAS